MVSKLPSNFITKDNAISKGWIGRSGNLQDIIPNGVIGGDIYQNKELILPDTLGRIWYEADINYSGGF